MAHSPIGLCLDCDYPLHDLPTRRCPECGRPFDPAVAPSLNAGPPLGPWRRLILRPVGWPTFAAAAVPLAGLWWVATDPALYQMGGEYILGTLTAIPVATVQLARALPKRQLEERLGLPPRDVRRWCAFWAMAAAAILGVFFGVPLRLAFRASQPAFEQVVAAIRANPAAPAVPPHAGLYTVSTYTDYGTPEAPILLIFTSGDGGFRYSPDGPHYFGFNPGDEGHLWGPWYWFSSD